MMADPYVTLGLSKSASDAEIKKAYRKVARSCHPDLKPDDKKAEATFKAATAAYDLLKDADTRARFDCGEIDANGAEQFNQSNPFRQRSGFDQQGDMSDVFSDFLRQRGFATRGADQRYNLNVDFLVAVKGGKARITLPEAGKIQVKIPIGSQDGQTIRLRGKGGAGRGNAPPGDALVTLNVVSHPVFRREGNDILMTLPITLDEAVLGGKVTTPTIEGTVKLAIPVGASSGQTLRLRGRGVNGRGDQMVTLSIVMPPEIDARLSEFMERWRKSNGYDPRKGMMTE